MNLKKSLATAAVAFAFSGAAVAGTATFTGATGEPNPYSEAGITFTSLNTDFSAHVHFDGPFADALWTHNGGCCTDPIEITQTGGGAFSLLSLDVLQLNGTSTFTGSNAAVYTVSGLGTINFGNLFANVTSVLWSVDFNGDATIDNVTVTSAVPEPETYAMMLAGLGLLGFAARRRKAKAAA